MAYISIDYNSFAPYSVERVAGHGVKKIVWNKIVSQREIDGFYPHINDERTKVFLQTQTCMPFDVYIVPANEAYRWCEYIKTQKSLQQIYNCVYLLWGHDFIYAGKSVNGDRILGHIDNDTKSGFDYQMLFAPNNENHSTMTNWTSDFMAYLESELINRIRENNPYCKNVIAGKDANKSRRDLNMNVDKEDFASNVIDLIIAVFKDISYSSYLLPEEKEPLILGEETNDADDSMLEFWNHIINVCDRDSKFSQLVKPQRGHVVYCNMNTNKLIANASICCVANQSTCRVELVGWGDRNSAEVNLENFDTLKLHKEEIEAEMGCQLQWNRKEGRYTTNISVSKSLRYTDTSIGTKRDIADFFSEYFDKFYTILPKYLDNELNEKDC